jgi:hypothetical protein
VTDLHKHATAHLEKMERLLTERVSHPHNCLSHSFILSFQRVPEVPQMINVVKTFEIPKIKPVEKLQYPNYSNAIDFSLICSAILQVSNSPSWEP